MTYYSALPISEEPSDTRLGFEADQMTMCVGCSLRTSSSGNFAMTNTSPNLVVNSDVVKSMRTLLWMLTLSLNGRIRWLA